METYMQIWQKMLKIKQLFIDLYVDIIMDIKKINNNLQKLRANIGMDVKKSTTIYETYMQVLHI